MAIALYGQNKDGGQIHEAAKNLSQVYRFGTPPNVSDYERPVAAQLIDGTAGDTTLHQYADGFECTLYPIVAQDNDAPAMTTTGADYSYEQDDGFHSPELVSKIVGIKLKKNQRVRLETPGGGGFGKPKNRNPKRLEEDIRLGYVTARASENPQ